LQPPSPLRWRSVPAHAIALREWDGECVVRNEATGNSHLLGPLAGRVLGILLGAGESLGADEIAARLEAAAPDTEASDGPGAIEAVLAEFRRLGLAESEST